MIDFHVTKAYIYLWLLGLTNYTQPSGSSDLCRKMSAFSRCWLISCALVMDCSQQKEVWGNVTE
jgi:hypothetical protein